MQKLLRHSPHFTAVCTLRKLPLMILSARFVNKLRRKSTGAMIFDVVQLTAVSLPDTFQATTLAFTSAASLESHLVDCFDCRRRQVFNGATRSSSALTTSASWSANESAVEAGFVNRVGRRSACSEVDMSMFFTFRNDTSTERTTERRTRILQWMSQWSEMRRQYECQKPQSAEAMTSRRLSPRVGSWTSRSSPNDFKNDCRTSSTCEPSVPRQLKSPHNNNLSLVLATIDAIRSTSSSMNDAIDSTGGR